MDVNRNNQGCNANGYIIGTLDRNDEGDKFNAERMIQTTTTRTTAT